jgi:hypothetical protein
MLDLHRTAHDHVGSVTAPPRSRALKRAWWSLALMPVAFVVATLLGNELLILQGIDPDAQLDVPIGQALLAGVPATLVLILPALAAFVFGRAVMRAGDMRGQVPAVIGGVFALFTLIVSTVTLILS